MLDAIDIAQSGMNVQRMRLRSAASNVANISTDNYQPTRVVARSQPGGGVVADVQPMQQPPTLVRNMVVQMTAVAAYEANVSVMRTALDAKGSLLDKLA